MLGLEYSDQLITNGNAVFVKFYPFNSILQGDKLQYEISGLPGNKEGVSGSILVGYNVGIYNNISEDKRSSAIETIKYFSSKEFQKSLVLKKIIISGILSLYEDENVCSNINNCEYYKDLQTIRRPIGKTDDLSKYMEMFVNYFNEYIYGDESEISILTKIDDYTKIYNIEVNTKEGLVGLIFVIIISLFLMIIVSSISLLYIKKYEDYFLFLPKHQWLMIIMGIILILLIGYTNIGEVSVLKCEIRYILLGVGYSFINLPLILKLIISFPEKNKYTVWIVKNKYLFLIFFILIEVLLDGLILIKPFAIEDVMVNKGKNFQICGVEDLMTKIMLLVVMIYRLFLMLITLLLVFIEWNNKDISIDLKLIVTCTYINLITYFVLLLFNFIIINNYISNFIMNESLIILMAFSNYVVLYAIRLIIPIIIKKDELEEIIDKIKCSNGNSFKSSENHDSYQSNNSDNNYSYKPRNSFSSSKRGSIYSKIINYHYNS